MNYYLDFDANPSDHNAVLQLVQTAHDMALEHQGVRDAQCERDYQNFHAFVDASSRDPDHYMLAIPKLYSIIMSRVPKMVRAVVGMRPYIPLSTERKEYNEVVKIYEKGVDKLLVRGGFRNNFVLDGFMSALYGTAFMEILPYYEPDVKKVVVPETMPGMYGEPVVTGYHIEEIPWHRLCFQARPYAIWEVKIDPFATDLETKEGCRYIVKIQLASKRQIKQMAAKGAYPGLDVAALDEKMPDYTKVNEHRGLRILQSMGIPEPNCDGDIGVLFRYESPDRYIDVWNDTTVIRDTTSNPYSETPGTGRRGHGLINLSRMIHNVDPHTQTRFYGNGHGKISEPLTTALNDHFCLTMDNANFTNQGMTYALDDGRIKKEDLVQAIGNKILFKPIPGVNSIRDMIMDKEAGRISPDFYALREILDDYINLTHRSFEPQIGKPVEGRHTLGELVMLRETGDSGDELTVSILENPFMTDVGTKALAHMEQFAKEDDWADLVGEEDAQKLIFAHPRDLPGRFDFDFKGSDKVINQLVMQRNLKELYAGMKDSPYLKRRNFEEKIFVKYDLGDEVDDLLYNEEEAQMISQQLAMQEQAREVESHAAKESISTQAKVAQGVPTQLETKTLQDVGRDGVAL